MTVADFFPLLRLDPILHIDLISHPITTSQKQSLLLPHHPVATKHTQEPLLLQTQLIKTSTLAS